MNAPRYIPRNSQENPNHIYALPADLTTNAGVVQRYNLKGPIEKRQKRSVRGLAKQYIYSGSESDSDSSDGGDCARDLWERPDGDLTLEELFERASLSAPRGALRARSWSVPTVQVLKKRTLEPRAWVWVFR
ncbi:hypothetical protein CLAFUW4_03963 [Fulvia fulva]|uniref:Uncharacterized protein n=1 Tax=Passalora fulva TaxID=5499 RepID=A0A9Q8P8L3_PASFU|nr:uncharacterized protein CLAFUR5_03928 [Fulvia fulva]KAK4624613.1 hypothetical protein CLAFUR4_05229 [Fulvia fulva]KAK4625370.1 hypothetical protein CLAFUR0_05235 [Fulvia fulva]KAK4626384.1 hypothetical protein CLAFUR4_03949 [Fulvia fulva]KAK4628029.1 hypothetical protein CLAFUR0_03950 [Fulvia fulva]UJO17011.1 hypothetical protein CLAFUR5_03928 [Fulvia fulva]